MTKSEIRDLIKASNGAPVKISWEKGQVRFVKVAFDGPMSDEQFENLLDEIVSFKQHGFLEIKKDQQHGYNIVTWERRMQEAPPISKKKR